MNNFRYNTPDSSNAGGWNTVPQPANSATMHFQGPRHPTLFPPGFDRPLGAGSVEQRFCNPQQHLGREGGTGYRAPGDFYPLTVPPPPFEVTGMRGERPHLHLKQQQPPQPISQTTNSFRFPQLPAQTVMPNYQSFKQPPMSDLSADQRNHQPDIPPHDTRFFPHSFKGNTSTVNKEMETTFEKKLSTENNLLDRQKEEDISWLNHWLPQQRKYRGSSHNQKSGLTISMAQEKMRQMLVLMAKLQKNVKLLELEKQADKTVWESKAKEVEQLKMELEKYHSELTNEDVVSNLKCKIQHRRKKRERLKKHKEEAWEQNQSEMVARQELNKKIDKSLENMAQRLRDKKQEEELKKEADSIMSEVRKKISEATKSISVLESLRKLRKLRSDRQERQGLRVASFTDPEKQLQSLQNMLEKQIEIYKSEDSALRVIVETEQEETREKTRERVRRREEEKQRQDEITQNKLLFGIHREPKPDDPIFPFQQYYKAGSQSLEAFVNIRREWDQYLVMNNVPGASRIPENWVIPTLPTSKVWASAIVEK